MPFLEWLHRLPHLSMSLQPVSSEFNLTADYLQSLMLIVALLLAVGFTTLVLLALYLCMIISFIPPTIQPPTACRVMVISIACALFVLASPAATASQQCARGLHSLFEGLHKLAQLVQHVRALSQRCART